MKVERDSVVGIEAHMPAQEVVAKLHRRQCIAEYQRRIVEEAERRTRPGEIGRLLRREALYTSHLSAWRKARRRGALRGLTPRKRRAKPAESTHSSSPKGCPQRGAGGTAREGIPPLTRCSSIRSIKPWSRAACRPFRASRRPISASFRTIGSSEPSRPHGLAERLHARRTVRDTIRQTISGKRVG